MTFEEAKEVKLSGDERRNLSSLKSNKDWITFQKIVENYIMQLTYNLIAGSENVRGLREQELERLSGFVYYWKKVKDLVENKDHHD